MTIITAQSSGANLESKQGSSAFQTLHCHIQQRFKMAVSFLPVNKGVIISTIVLDLKHSDSRNISLKIKFK